MQNRYYSFRHLVTALLLYLPVATVLSRDPVLRYLVSLTHTDTVSVSNESPRNCVADLCYKDTTVVVPASLAKVSRLAIGVHSAFIDVDVLDGLSRLDAKRPIDHTWFRFRVFPVSSKSVVLRTVGHADSKKLGIESNVVYLGDEQKLRKLGLVFELFNIHLYGILGLVALCFGLLLITSDRSNSDFGVPRFGLLTFLTFGALILYGHVADSIVTLLGVNSDVSSSLGRAFFGALLLLHFWDRKYSVHVALFFLLSFCVALSVPQLQAIFIYKIYRFLVLGLCLLVFFRAIKRDRLAIWFFPLIALDSLVIFGICEARSGVYLSPLGLFGLLISSEFNRAARVINQHREWYRRNFVSRHLDSLREKQQASIEDWKELFAPIGRSLSVITKARKVGIIYLGPDGPVILSFWHGRLAVYKDGKIPPVFARVFQTKEPLWWIHASELEKLNGRPISPIPHSYESDYAVIIPIVCGGDVYGAISLTDFDSVERIIEDSDSRTSIQGTISSFVDLLSTKLIQVKEKSNSNTLRMSNDIVSLMGSQSIESVPFSGLMALYCENISRVLSCKTLFFKFDSRSRGLELVAFHGFVESSISIWKGIPFKARLENKISPFAIAVNESRPIWIDDIRPFFNLLTDESITALKASQTRSFFCAPVCFGEATLGLVALLDSDTKKLDSDTEAVMRLPLEHLGFSTHHKATGTALARFADSEVVGSLVQNGKANFLGSTYSGTLFIADLRDSSLAAHAKFRDPSLYAKALSRFYLSVESVAAEYGVDMDRTAGDGILAFLLKGSETNSLAFAISLLKRVKLAGFSTMGTSDAIVTVHFGSVFRGVLGTRKNLSRDIVGADLNDTFKLEKTGKSMPGTQMVLSSAYIDSLPHLLVPKVRSLCVSEFTCPDTRLRWYSIGEESVVSLEALLFSLERKAG